MADVRFAGIGHGEVSKMVNGDTTTTHYADVIAALTKRGLTLRQLAKINGVSASGLSNALRRPSKRAEEIIAQALDTTPAQLWPDRFGPDGYRIRERGWAGRHNFRLTA